MENTLHFPLLETESRHVVNFVLTGVTMVGIMATIGFQCCDNYTVDLFRHDNIKKTIFAFSTFVNTELMQVVENKKPFILYSE